FHERRHPSELSAAHVESFLTNLAMVRNVAPATQAQALAAVLFLYKHVLKLQLPWLSNVVRAKRPKRLPVVLSREETRRVLSHLEGPFWLAASLLYGSGLRVLEALRMRVKDVDFDRHILFVRNAKGAKDRITVLPDSLLAPMQNQIEQVRELHEYARRKGF